MRAGPSRAPDLPGGDSELVPGFSGEYAGGPLAPFLLAECARVVTINVLTTIPLTGIPQPLSTDPGRWNTGPRRKTWTSSDPPLGPEVTRAFTLLRPDTTDLTKTRPHVGSPANRAHQQPRQTGGRNGRMRQTQPTRLRQALPTHPSLAQDEKLPSWSTSPPKHP